MTNWSEKLTKEERARFHMLEEKIVHKARELADEQERLSRELADAHRDKRDFIRELKDRYS